MLALFLLALVLRGAWVAAINPDPLDGRFDDTLFYDRSATALADGKGYINFEKKPTARWPIGYSGLVASLYVVFGRNLLAPRPSTFSWARPRSSPSTSSARASSTGG